MAEGRRLGRGVVGVWRVKTVALRSSTSGPADGGVRTAACLGARGSGAELLWVF